MLGKMIGRHVELSTHFHLNGSKQKLWSQLSKAGYRLIKNHASVGSLVPGRNIEKWLVFASCGLRASSVGIHQRVHDFLTQARTHTLPALP
jgi:hypothetical protein